MSKMKEQGRSAAISVAIMVIGIMIRKEVVLAVMEGRKPHLLLVARTSQLSIRHTTVCSLTLSQLGYIYKYIHWGVGTNLQSYLVR